MYSFRCKQCGHDFEELVSMSRLGEVVCPECGGQAERSWEGAGAFSVGASAEKKGMCEAPCASSCGCGGACRCAHE